MDNLTGKTIFITGGAQGIGEATARLVAQRGATVIIADLKADQGEAVAQSIASIGAQCSFIQLDVRDEAQVQAAFEQVKAQHGKLDSLVCAAGILKGAFQTPEELPTEVFQMVQDVNVRGVFLCAKFATPLLEASKGVMVVIASGAGVIGPVCRLAYGASKGGANGLGMTLGGHLASRGIRVNVLCPGNIVTEMKLSVDIARAEMDGRDKQEAFDYANQNYGVPEGMAKIIAFMVSDDADYLRGTLFTR